MSDFLLMAVAIFGAGILRGLTGFGFALAAVPLLSLVVPPLHAVVIAQVLQVAQSPFDFYQNREHVDLPAVGRLLLGAVLLVPVGVAVAGQVSPDLLRLVIAVVVIVGLIALMSRVKIPGGKGPAVIAGGVAGLFSGLAAMPGPPIVAYFLGRGSSPKETRASSLVFFAVAAALALCTSMLMGTGAGGGLIGTALLGLPVLLAGSQVGTWMFNRMADEGYRRAAIALMILSALITGVRGMIGIVG